MYASGKNDFISSMRLFLKASASRALAFAIKSAAQIDNSAVVGKKSLNSFFISVLSNITHPTRIIINGHKTRLKTSALSNKARKYTISTCF